MSPSDCTWVSDRLGIGVGGRSAVVDLAGLAVRHNPRRAHLVVSRVLGKHVPVHPWQAVEAGRQLGRLAARRLTARRPAADRGPDGSAPSAVVLGYAETATALGHLVSEVFDGAWYLHTTRRPVAGIPQLGSFEETHSHARRHLLLPADRGWLATGAAMVIVDDELTTGATAITTIRAIQAVHPRSHYLIATLLDLRTPADRAVLASAAEDLGVTVDVVALATAELVLPSDVLTRGEQLASELDVPDPVRLGKPAPVHRIDAVWPDGLPHGGRHGFGPGHRGPFSAAIADLGRTVSRTLPDGGRVLVLGTEELMYAPMMLAENLAGGRAEQIRFASTTRSPVLPVDTDGYAVRTRLSFTGHDPVEPGDTPLRFVYNIAPHRAGRPFDHIVVVVDAVADTPALWEGDGLIEAVRRCCDGVSVVVLPAEQPVAGSGPPVPRPADSGGDL